MLRRKPGLSPILNRQFYLTSPAILIVAEQAEAFETLAPRDVRVTFLFLDGPAATG